MVGAQDCLHAAHACSRFGKLPAYVRIVLTSRPEAAQDAYDSTSATSVPKVADMFKAWEPVGIEPSSDDNQADVELVLRHRLSDEAHVAPHDVEAAVAVMKRKSQASGGNPPHA
jgi:hypothetical protein